MGIDDILTKLVEGKNGIEEEKTGRIIEEEDEILKLQDFLIKLINYYETKIISKKELRDSLVSKRDLLEKFKESKLIKPHLKKLKELLAKD